MFDIYAKTFMTATRTTPETLPHDCVPVRDLGPRKLSTSRRFWHLLTRTGKCIDPGKL